MKTRLDIPRPLEGQLWRFRLPVSGLHSHRHAELELEHVLRGEATLAVGGRQLALAPHSLVWIRPGEEHQIVEHSDDFEMWIACFRRGLVRRTLDRAQRRTLLRGSAEELAVRRLDGPEARRLCALLAEVSAYEDPDSYNAGLAYVLAHAWLEYRQASA